MKMYFFVVFSTRSGYRQSLRFHTPEPIEFESFDAKTKDAFILNALHSHGIEFRSVNPETLFVLQAFATEAECSLAYRGVRGDKPGLAPLASREN